ncbi:MAG: hypothetical protein KDA99_04395, partial [Planctomycetales bacterium]|nr:hypothetical protein [Planctomycetales bacterium]
DNVAANSRGLSDSGNSERWLENMVADHRFTADEVRLATGMSLQQATDAVKRYRMRAATDRATRNNDDAAVDAPAHGSTRILPYPGGRHPRRGFLEGAIHPQRETKVSVFAPWADGGYAVVDVPEAIFSNLGLTYLAHTHIPTVWDARQVTLPKLEWQETKDGLTCQRVLPNGIAFKCDVHAVERGAEMSISLTNGTDQPLTGLRVQVCTMLKGLVGFNLQQSLPQIVRDPVIAVRAWGTDRWLLTGWTPNHRVWTNPPVPCLHSDPVFPDCQPGQTVVVRGVLKYFAGAEIEAEIEQVQRLLRE